MSSMTTLATPHLLSPTEQRRLLAGAPWKRLVVMGDSIAAGVGDPTPGYPDRPWGDVCGQYASDRNSYQFGGSMATAAEFVKRSTHHGARLVWVLPEGGEGEEMTVDELLLADSLGDGGGMGSWVPRGLAWTRLDLHHGGGLVTPVQLSGKYGRKGDLHFDLVFADGSQISTAEFPRDKGDADAVDEGLALLEPITKAEHVAVERILSVLGEAALVRGLSEWQESQILLIADLIRAARNDAVPEETQRWRLIGLVLRGLRYLAREGPKDALAWWKLAEILGEIDWHNVVKALSVAVR